MTPPILIGVVAYETCGWFYQQYQRRAGYAQAEAEARRRHKPFLVGGEPMGEYPCPSGPQDVLVDLVAQSACSNHVRTSVEDLGVFGAGQFGAAFVSFTLEMVCDPQQAIRELHRVADCVFVVYSAPWRLSGYLLPARKWTITRNQAGGLDFHALPGKRCNMPTRYGTERATAFGAFGAIPEVPTG